MKRDRETDCENGNELKKLLFCDFDYSKKMEEVKIKGNKRSTMKTIQNNNY